jgi:DNA repair exonuclease SbcCD nuclease subunit
MILVTDTHLGLYNSSKEWHDVVKNLFIDIVDTALRRNEDTLLHLGDFFHEKKSIDSRTLEVTNEIIEILEPLKVFLITGNHDIYYKYKINPSTLKVFKPYKHIEVITEPKEIDSNILIPWASEIPESKCKYCFGHFDINGFFLNSKKMCSDGRYNIEQFRQFEKVYSGHFHTPSQKDNITYLGSPYQQTFHDVGSSRGYYIFDDGETEFIEFKDAPRFTILKSSDIIDEESVSGNIVKFIFDKDYGTNKNTELIEKIQALGPMKLSTDFSNIITEEEDNEEIDESIIQVGHEAVMEEWIDRDKRKMSIDKNKAKIILRKMVEELE